MGRRQLSQAKGRGPRGTPPGGPPLPASSPRAAMARMVPWLPPLLTHTDRETERFLGGQGTIAREAGHNTHGACQPDLNWKPVQVWAVHRLVFPALNRLLTAFLCTCGNRAHLKWSPVLPGAASRGFASRPGRAMQMSPTYLPTCNTLFPGLL